jgi:hypothetical protein
VININIKKYIAKKIFGLRREKNDERKITKPME